MSEPMFRYESGSYSDAERISIYCREVPAVRETPKGVWVDDYGRKRFVLNSAHKKWAARTKDEAWAEFRRRKQLHLGFLSRQHDYIADIVKAIGDKDLQEFTAAHSTNLFGHLYLEIHRDPVPAVDWPLAGELAK